MLSKLFVVSNMHVQWPASIVCGVASAVDLCACVCGVVFCASGRLCARVRVIICHAPVSCALSECRWVEAFCQLNCRVQVCVCRLWRLIAVRHGLELSGFVFILCIQPCVKFPFFWSGVHKSHDLVCCQFPLILLISVPMICAFNKHDVLHLVIVRCGHWKFPGWPKASPCVACVCSVWTSHELPCNANDTFGTNILRLWQQYFVCKGWIATDVSDLCFACTEFTLGCRVFFSTPCDATSAKFLRTWVHLHCVACPFLLTCIAASAMVCALVIGLHVHTMLRWLTKRQLCERWHQDYAAVFDISRIQHRSLPFWWICACNMLFEDYQCLTCISFKYSTLQWIRSVEKVQDF